MPETIVVLDPITETTATRLRALLPEGFVLTHGTTRGEEHLKAIIAEADYAISGQVGVSGEVLRAARRLKLLQKWGVGTDNLDVATAAELGIPVARTTGSNAVPVAEFTIGLMLAALRQIAHAHKELQNGGTWLQGRLPRDSFLLSGKTVGIIGFGTIGKTVARFLTGFGCPILYTKRTPGDPETDAALGATRVELADLLARSDIVSLHCPLTKETAGMIDRAALSSMKRTAILVNLARGGIVREDDLVWALTNGVIHAAATDVYDIEPVPADSPLLKLNNCVVTPHLAAGAADNFEKAVRHMYRNIALVARGEPVPAIDLVRPTAD